MPVYLSRPVKQFSGSRQPLVDIALEGFEALLASGGLPPEAVLVTSAHPWELAGVTGGDIVTAVAARAKELGLDIRVEFYSNPGLEEPTAHLAASAAGAALVHEGVRRVDRGEVHRLAVLGVEQMRLTDRATTTSALRSLIHPDERTTGITMPALGALLTRRFEADFPRLHEALTGLTIANRARSAANPRAHMRKTIRREEIAGERNPMVSEPLRLFDVAPTSSGYAGLFLSSEPGALETEVVVAGIGRGIDRLSVAHRQLLGPIPEFLAGARPPGQAGVSPCPGATAEAMNELLGGLEWTFGELRRNVAYAEIHDAFPIIEFMSLLDSGLAGRDEIVAEILAGAFAPDGRLPVNVMGGVMGGHPIGATGVGQVVELLLQALGRAETPVSRPATHYALALNVGGPLTYNCVTLLCAFPKGDGPPREFRISPRDHATAADIDRAAAPPLASGAVRVLSATRLEFPPPGFEAPCHLALVTDGLGSRFTACTGEPPPPGGFMELPRTNGSLEARNGSLEAHRPGIERLISRMEADADQVNT